MSIPLESEAATLSEWAETSAKRDLAELGFEKAVTSLAEVIEKDPRVSFYVLKLAALKRLAAKVQATPAPNPSS